MKYLIKISDEDTGDWGDEEIDAWGDEEAEAIADKMAEKGGREGFRGDDHDAYQVTCEVTIYKERNEEEEDEEEDEEEEEEEDDDEEEEEDYKLIRNYTITNQYDADHEAMIRTVTSDPDIIGHEHEWKGFGGCKENPGVFGGLGTNLLIQEKCSCGLIRNEYYRGEQRNPGEAVTSFSYEIAEEEEEEDEEEEDDEEE